MSIVTQNILLTIACVSLTSIVSPISTRKSHRLALLVASPWEGETAMHNDLIAMDEALRKRGYTDSEILILEGTLSRKSLLSFIQEANRKIAKWNEGEVFLYFGGHGFYSGSTSSEARPGLLLTNDPQYSHDSAVFWDEVFTNLNVPLKVKLIILPDN